MNDEPVILTIGKIRKITRCQRNYPFPPDNSDPDDAPSFLLDCDAGSFVLPGGKPLFSYGIAATVEQLIHGKGAWITDAAAIASCSSVWWNNVRDGKPIPPVGAEIRILDETTDPEAFRDVARRQKESAQYLDGVKTASVEESRAFSI